jgi:hypothetical protein
MYMAPIVRTRPAPSRAARLLVGTPALLLAASVMVPWLLVIGVATAAVLGLKLLAAAPRTLVQAVDYAGEAALGR